VTRLATPKLHTYLGLFALLLVAGIATGRAELIIIATPLGVALILGLAEASQPRGASATVTMLRERVLEGETTSLTVAVASDRSAPLMDVALLLPDGLDPPRRPTTLARIPPDRPERFTLPLTCRHWGGYSTGRVAIRVRSAYGFIQDEQVLESHFSLRVYPSGETIRTLVAPRDTQPSAGNLVARGSGSGIEFADLRPYQAGDELRHVNWRATARRGSVWVSTRHPEQNADVILFLDTFADVRGARLGTLDLTVRAAAALAARYLEDRDRVGVIGFGGTLRWLLPGTGTRQLYQIVESLITTGLAFSYAWKDISVIPPGTLPAQALIVAASPLVDPRGTAAMFDLLRRGFDVAILDISPEPFLPPPTDRAGSLARRLWKLERELLISRYRELGGAVTTWSGDRPLETAVEEVTRFRRHARIVRAS
jgi:uncharacterized protein (DUF58 family)